MYRLLYEDLKKNILIIIFIVIAQVVATVVGAILPYFNGNFVDVLIYGATKEVIIQYALIIAFIGICNCIFSYIYMLKKVKVKNNMSFELNSKGIQHLHKTSLQNSYEPVYMTQRINSDCTIIVSFFFDQVITAYINIIQLLFFLFLFFKLNKQIFSLVLLFSLIYIVIYQKMKTPLYNSNLQYKEQQSIFFNKLSEQLSLIEEIKIHSNFSIFNNLLRKSYILFFKHIYKCCKLITIFETLDQAVCLLFQIMTLVIGGIQVINGSLTVGEYSIINIYFSNLLSMIKYYFSFGKDYQDVKCSVSRMKAIFNMKLEKNGDMRIDLVEKIKISDLSVRGLFHLNEEFVKGKMHVIVGKNGVGKTSLIKGILGTIQNISGEIAYSDRQIDNVDLYELRKNRLSVMLQNEKVPSMTIEDYLCCTLEIDSFEDIENKISDYKISEIFNGVYYDLSNIRKKNLQKISDGEKQIILIVRTLLKPADVYIFDEPTSNLNNTISRRLMDYLEGIKKEKIIILVSHDEVVIDRADVKIEIYNDRDNIHQIKSIK